MTSDVVVVGGGAIGLGVAFALAQRHARVTLVEQHRNGEASPAAAGMLAPNTEFADHAEAQPFVTTARDRYPGFVEQLRASSGRDVPLDQTGVIQIALDDREAESLQASRSPASEWLDARALATVEPNLSARVRGGVRYLRDGAIDPRVLLTALTIALDTSPFVTRINEAVHTVELRKPHEATGVTTSGARYTAPHLVIAAGAWAPQIAGLPRPLPIEPLRGQILMLGRAALNHVIYGPNGYLVPRTTTRATVTHPAGTHTLVGSTMERVGFATDTTPTALRTLSEMAQRLCPKLRGAPKVAAWAGLRPVTPDLLPIIGRDPDEPSLLYACGHSRNGILMTPLTAESIAALVLQEPPPIDLTPFRVDRFSA